MDGVGDKGAATFSQRFHRLKQRGLTDPVVWGSVLEWHLLHLATHTVSFVRLSK